MNILEQSCNKPTELKQRRVMILCDPAGFTRIKEFLHNEISDSIAYIEDNVDSIDELFVMTDDEDYIISCEDYIFINLLNVILCTHGTYPFKNIPSIFYDVFFDPQSKDLIEEVRQICNIDCDILKDSLDNNMYEILHDVNWFDVSEEATNKHLFIDVEIITTMTNSEKLQMLFNNAMYMADFELDYSYIKPIDINEGTKEYKLWEKFITSSTDLKYQLHNLGMSYETCKGMLPGCTARKVKIAANIKAWKDFFDKIINDRCIVNGPTERDLVKKIAEYMLDIVVREDFRTKILNLINDLNTYDELPF